MRRITPELAAAVRKDAARGIDSLARLGEKFGISKCYTESILQNRLFPTPENQQYPRLKPYFCPHCKQFHNTYPCPATPEQRPVFDKTTPHYVNELDRRHRESERLRVEKETIRLAVWRRFCREAKASGIYDGEFLRQYEREKRESLIKRHLSKNGGWKFRLRSTIEATIFHREDFAKRKIKNPATARPGSPEKQAILAARLMEGSRELHSPNDVNCLVEPYEATEEKVYKMSDFDVVGRGGDVSEWFIDNSTGD
jgi:hypothetical protein